MPAAPSAATLKSPITQATPPAITAIKTVDGCSIHLTLALADGTTQVTRVDISTLGPQELRELAGNIANPTAFATAMLAAVQAQFASALS